MADLPGGGDPITNGVLWRSAPDAFALDAPGLARFHVAHGQTLETVPAPGVGEAEARLLAHGLPQAARWVQRGYLVLHAAAVVTPRGAVALAGHSGVGKSVVATALAQRGAALLADEALAVELRSGGELPLAHPGETGVLLWARAASRLGYAPESLTPARSGLARYWLPPLPSASTPYPLVRVYCLATYNRLAVKIEVLRGHERVLALMRNSFNRRLSERPAQRQQTMLRLAALPQWLRVARLSRPDAGWSADAILVAIEEDLAA